MVIGSERCLLSCMKMFPIQYSLKTNSNGRSHYEQAGLLPQSPTTQTENKDGESSTQSFKIDLVCFWNWLWFQLWSWTNGSAASTHSLTVSQVLGDFLSPYHTRTLHSRNRRRLFTHTNKAESPQTLWHFQRGLTLISFFFQLCFQKIKVCTNSTNLLKWVAYISDNKQQACLNIEFKDPYWCCLIE